MIHFINTFHSDYLELVRESNSIAKQYPEYYRGIAHIFEAKITNTGEQSGTIEDKIHYTVLHQIDVPKVRKNIDFAELEPIKAPNQPSDCEAIGYIKIREGKSDSEVHLRMDSSERHLIIKGSFGFKEVRTLVDIKYIESDFWQVTLYDMECSRYIGCYTEPKETLLVKDVDYTIIEDNIHRLIIEEGYLLDNTSLNYLKEFLTSRFKFLK